MAFISTNTNNPLAQRPLNFMARSQALGSLGSLSAESMSNALAMGVAPNDVNLLNSIGATDDDISALLSGSIDLTALYAKYGVTIPSASSTSPASASSGQPSAQASTPTAQSPSGSKLLYTATWTAGVGNLTVTVNNVISGLQGALPSYGMAVAGSAVTSGGPITYGIQVQISDSVGHALITDAQSVLDALMRKIVGNNLSSSQMSLISTPGQAAGQPGSSTDITTWIEDNAFYIGAGLLAVIVLPALIKKL